MIEYWEINQRVAKSDEWRPGCWTCVTMPSAEEIDALQERYHIPAFFLHDISDADERARYDSEDGWQLIIMRVPYVKPGQSRTPYITVPLGIIIKDDVLITVCHFHVNILEDFVKYNMERNIGFVDHADFIFHLFFSTAEYYLMCLKQIDQIIERAKIGIDSSIDNKALISLSLLQDSLTYFMTSIKGNESLLAKLRFKLPVDELDDDLIEDVNIEMSQAKETTSIYAEILDSTMNTYSSIINNNMNSVMKVLTSVSIILMFPTLIASFFGMNLLSGLENSSWGFAIAITISVVVSIGCWLLFRLKKLV